MYNYLDYRLENVFSSFPSVFIALRRLSGTQYVLTEHLSNAFLEAKISFHAKLRNDLFSFPLQMATWPQLSHLV